MSCTSIFIGILLLIRNCAAAWSQWSEDQAIVPQSNSTSGSKGIEHTPSKEMDWHGCVIGLCVAFGGIAVISLLLMLITRYKCRSDGSFEDAMKDESATERIDEV